MITEAASRRIGYKMLFSICETPSEILGRIDGVSVSPEVAECEAAAAQKRLEDTEIYQEFIRAAATWMADVVVDDVCTEEDELELKETLKDEYATDFAAFGVALLGILLEEGCVVPK